jgi:hypothetical protein
MTTPTTIEVPAGFVGTVQRFVAFLQEMEDVALKSPDGHVVDDCEGTVLASGREVQQRALAEALQRRIEVVEKKGHRSGSAPVGEPKRTAARPPVSS